MAFDGITLHCITTELQSLIGGKVDKIYIPEQNNVLLGIYKDKQNFLLNIYVSADNYRVHLTTNLKPNPQVAPNFCMVLRKHLIGYRIANIYTRGLERILYIEFEGLSAIDNKITKTLIIELMGRYSNVILVNSEFKILESFKRFSKDIDSSDNSRELMPGKFYFLPKTNKLDFLSLTKAEFISACLNSEFNSLTDAIISIFNGISKQFVTYALHVLNLSNTVAKSNLEAFWNYLTSILDKNFTCTSLEKNYVVTSSDSPTPYQVNFFIDDYYYQKLINDDFKNYRNTILKVLDNTLDKITKKIDNIDKKASECKDIDKNKLYAELITANLYSFDNSPLNKKSLNLLNYYDNSEIDVPVNRDLSAKENAQKYFKKYNKMKSTLSSIANQKDEALKELDYLQSLIFVVNEAKTVEDLDGVYDEISESMLYIDSSKLMKFQKNKSTINEYNRNLNKLVKNKKGADLSSLKNYYKFTIDDYEVLVGKNNLQNDYLVKKVAAPNDIWFHTKDIHGSHVILRVNGDTPKISTIEACAKLAAHYSKAKYSSHVPVDYTLVKYVSKPNGAKPGYVIYTNNKTIYVNP